MNSAIKSGKISSAKSTFTPFLLYILHMAFSEEYLKDYEKKIRELPVEELYDILSQIRDHGFQADDSPERIKIIEKRIIELTGDKDSILPMPQYSQKLNEKYLNKTTLGSFTFKIGGLVLILVGIGFSDNTSNQYTPFNFITCGLGLLVFVLGCLFDGQIRLYVRDLTAVRTREDQPRDFWFIISILGLIGVGLIIWGLL